eukprot:10112504-Ditylum_brightwellii.AAC.2
MKVIKSAQGVGEGGGWAMVSSQIKQPTRWCDIRIAEGGGWYGEDIVGVKQVVTGRGFGSGGGCMLAVGS